MKFFNCSVIFCIIGLYQGRVKDCVILSGMKDLVNFSEFSRLDLRIGEIIGAMVPEESETLVKLTVDFGDEGKRIIFAGIKKWYEPEELVGTRSVFVLNLKPKKTPFGDSEGMLLVAGEEQAYLLSVPDEVEIGTSLR